MAFASKSPWLLHYDAASCNGCDIEVLACLTPLYDVERFGIINTGNPRHADILLVTGSVNEQCAPVLQQIYSQMVEPKVVIAVGICACSGGIFHDCYNVYGGIDKVVPVDVYVAGCAARPQAIIDGVVKAIGILDEKRASLAAGVPIKTPQLKGGVEIPVVSKEAPDFDAEKNRVAARESRFVPAPKEDLPTEMFTALVDESAPAADPAEELKPESEPQPAVKEA
ncbi:MAG: NADH-quinone oxidoreductase subunit NuoB [Coriobacteriales bacterium]|nr:NADH-quinone oxidoreductase subunit NuoB [Coriobacteriales bacterium]